MYRNLLYLRNLDTEHRLTHERNTHRFTCGAQIPFFFSSKPIQHLPHMSFYICISRKKDLKRFGLAMKANEGHEGYESNERHESHEVTKLHYLVFGSRSQKGVLLIDHLVKSLVVIIGLITYIFQFNFFQSFIPIKSLVD